MNKDKKTKNLVLSALFAAMVCLTTAYLFHIPTVNGGYIHLGDTFIYLASCILPMPYAMIAAALGAGMADMLSGAMIWIIPTVIIKPILVTFFTAKYEKFLCTKNIIAVFLAGITGVLGYYIASVIITGNFLAPLATLVMDFIQPIGSGVVFITCAYILDKIKFKSRVLNKQ